MLKTEGKVKLSLCAVKHHTTKVCGGVEMKLQASQIPNLATRWKWVVCLMLCALYLWGNGCMYPLHSRAGELWACLDTLEKREVLLLCQKLKNKFLGHHLTNTANNKLRSSVDFTSCVKGKHTHAYHECHVVRVVWNILTFHCIHISMTSRFFF